MEIIKLSNPLLVNGNELVELPYDTDAISVEQFVQAEAYARDKYQTRVVCVEEFDYGFHLYLGFTAIMAADPSIDVHDLERLSGTDIMKIVVVGRNFTGTTSESPDEGESEESASVESKSELPSESTQKSSTRASTR